MIPTKYVKFISSDDIEYIVEKATCTDLLTHLCNSASNSEDESITIDEKENVIIHFKLNILRGEILEYVVKYLEYREKEMEKFRTDETYSGSEFPIPIELVLDILMAAHHLGI